MTEIKEVSENIYMIIIDMPEPRVKSVNKMTLYAVKGINGGRNLLVDTGINREECYESIMQAYRQIGIRPEDTDVFITHLHPDHCGLVWHLRNESNIVMAAEREAALINQMKTESYKQYIYSIYRQEGLPMDYKAFDASHPNCDCYARNDVDFSVVSECDCLEYGGYSFRCVVMPGHSPEHTSLYDEQRKIMIGGDVILDEINPVLFFEPDFDNPLKYYLKTLDRLEKFDVDIILTAHGNINFDIKCRIAELRNYYNEQFDWIREKLKENGALNAWQIAELMIERDFHRGIETVSAVSRWFFFLPACAFIRYMSRENMVKMSSDKNGVHVYEL